jgi:hypothetical protein
MPHKKITKLKDAIRATHGCESLHVKSVPVKEVFEGQTAWQGTVEVFDLIGHPKAKRAYAWTYRDGDQDKTIAVLALPPVDSPQSALKVAIAAKGRSNQHWQKWYDLTKISRLESLRSGMKILASQIDRELQSGKWKHCAVYEAELQRLWPLNEDNREAKIAQFAKKYGFRLRFYDKGLCAIFDKWPRPKRRL